MTERRTAIPKLRSDVIREMAESLATRYGTRDPFLLCRAMRIHILPLRNRGPLRGFYRIIKRNRYLFLSTSLSYAEKRAVCAHELGHACLHGEMAKETPLSAFTVGTPSPSEYEADLFASVLLLPDEVLRRLFMEGRNTEEIAARAALPESWILMRTE